jgi:hypothetical protein
MTLATEWKCEEERTKSNRIITGSQLLIVPTTFN